MSVIWALTKKELRMLLRDPVAMGLLVGMPLLFTLVQGLLLGESFGQKPDESLRISLVNLDQGKGLEGKPWSEQVLTDLKETPGIRIEIVPTRKEAERLIRDHKRAAILVLNADFSERLNHCSFLDTRNSVNPFHREGVHLDPNDPKNIEGIDLGVELLKDPTQLSTGSIIEQVVQVSMLRVILPFMIGQAFNKLSDADFITRLGEEVRLPVPADFPALYNSADKLLKDKRVQLVRLADSNLDKTLKQLEEKMKGFKPLAESERVQLAELIRLASGKDEKRAEEYRAKVGDGVKAALKRYFRKYNLQGMTWAALTKSAPTEEAIIRSAMLAWAGPHDTVADCSFALQVAQSPIPALSQGYAAKVTQYVDRDGAGFLRRGAHRYQLLVPAFTVMFSFFLVLIVGWIFVTERRQGTLLRLRAAPLTRAQILLGKLIPCFVMSFGQGVALLVAGRVVFGMRWGPDNWSLVQQSGWLLLVIFCTSLAAMGLALLVAAVARTEIQVALYGAVPVLVLALIGGCLLPREMMPEQTQQLSLLTPQGWALNAYRELLNPLAGYQPNLAIVGKACGVLAAFGAAFLALAWGLLRLE